MAKNISDLPVETTIPDSAIEYWGIPDGTNPYGFRDARVTKANSHIEITNQVTQNVSDIATNTAAIAALGTDNYVIPSLSGGTSESVGTEAKIFGFDLIVLPGSAITFKAGTIAGGSDIIRESDPIAVGEMASFELNKTFNGGGIYLTVTGGSAKILVRRDIDIFNI